MGVVLHPKKRYEIPVRDGVEFLGVKVYRDHIVPGERLRRNLADTVYALATCGEGELTRLRSYDGLMIHFDSEKMIRRIFGAVSWDYLGVENRRQ